MRRAPFALLALTALAVLLAGCLQSPAAAPTPVPTAGVAALLNVTVVVNNGTANETTPLALANGTTAFDAFDRAAALNYTAYDIGYYVTGVNGLEANADNNGHYWQYYFNGALAPVAVDRFSLTESGVLEFRYELPPEGQWGS